VLVIGFGNELLGDDGCGPAVVRLLGSSSHVRAVDGHTDALLVPGLWAGEREVWLVDAVVRGAPPGTVHHLAHEEVLSIPQRHGTAHQLSLPESLRWVALSCPDMAGVRYRLWGIEPGRMSFGEGLTGAVAAATAIVAAEIEREATASGNPDTIRRLLPFLDENRHVL